MIAVHKLCVQTGAFALRDLSFEIPEDSYAVLMGPTGAGKTTLIEAICGLRPILSGEILLRHENVTRLQPGQRHIGYVPQDGALFNSMSVHENMAFPLTIRHLKPAPIKARIQQLADWLKISHLLGRRIHGLSGGERQRIALGRALAARPTVLCLDEPLSALDDQTRLQMVELLRSVHRHEAVTILHITHNQEDADQLATLFLKLRDGKITTSA